MKWFFSTLSKRIIFLFIMGIIIIQLTTFWFIESTLNIHMPQQHKHQFVLENVIFYIVSITFSLILGAIILLRWLVKPLENMAETVSHFKNPNEKLEFQNSNTKEVMLLGTAINQMQTRMVQLIEQRTYALAAISHDLKTPLTRMRMRLEEVNTKKLQNSFAQDLTDMEQMVDSTLYFLKSGGNEEQKQIVDLYSILETIENELTDSGFKTTVINQFQGKTLVFGQHYALKRALSNIIYNAIKYGDEAKIHVSHMNNNALIVVEDKGNGIDPANFEKVFEPFVRLEQSRNFNTGGFGLGLTIAKTIIDNHQGQLQLALNDTDSLKVTITLPLHIKKS